jgi:DNA topoisomerase III
VLPLGRVVNDARVTDHHAIIPTRAEHHPVDKMSDDDKKIYDLVVRRFLAVFHPEAVIENTRVETTVADHVFRTRGKRILVPGWRGVYGERESGEGGADSQRSDDDEGREQQLPRLDQGEHSAVQEVGSEAKETKPPRRYTDGSLVTLMETAGKLVDDEEAREAMKESGIGTPATRATIIERLIQVGYVERDGRALVVTEKGMNVIRLLGEHALTSPGLTGEWESRLTKIETGADSREAFMGDIVKFIESTVGELDTKLKDVRIERANLGPCPVCGRDRPHGQGGHRVQGTLGAQLPGQAGLATGRGRQVARRVRRAVGQGGREAARAGGAHREHAGARRRGIRRSRTLRRGCSFVPSAPSAIIDRWLSRWSSALPIPPRRVRCWPPTLPRRSVGHC